MVFTVKLLDWKVIPPSFANSGLKFCHGNEDFFGKLGGHWEQSLVVNQRAFRSYLRVWLLSAAASRSRDSLSIR